MTLGTKRDPDMDTTRITACSFCNDPIHILFSPQVLHFLFAYEATAALAFLFISRGLLWRLLLLLFNSHQIPNGPRVYHIVYLPLHLGGA